MVLLCASIGYAQDDDAPSVKTSDLKMIVGNWTGTITYLDYRSGKPFTMPANLEVKMTGYPNKLLLYNTYPNEPEANDTDKLKLSKKGTHLNKAKVVSREVLPNGQVVIMAQKKGKDDNKKAMMRYTYTVSENQFVIRKDVKFDGAEEWVQRNEFKYAK